MMEEKVLQVVKKSLDDIIHNLIEEWRSLCLAYNLDSNKYPLYILNSKEDISNLHDKYMKYETCKDKITFADYVFKYRAPAMCGDLMLFSTNTYGIGDDGPIMDVTITVESIIELLIRTIHRMSIIDIISDLNTTLRHEMGHVLYIKYLFDKYPIKEATEILAKANTETDEVLMEYYQDESIEDDESYMKALRAYYDSAAEKSANDMVGLTTDDMAKLHINQ